jgi:hypothetical protein
MITLTRTSTALPGKLPELLAIVKESVAVAKRQVGIDITVGVTMGSNPLEVVGTSHYSSLSHLEEVAVKLATDTEWNTLLKRES